MIIILSKGSGRSVCRGKDCKGLPDYIKNGRIKSGSTCVEISMVSAAGRHTSYYCRDCVDKLYSDMKTILNPQLWIFH